MGKHNFYKTFGINKDDKEYLSKQLLYNLYKKPKKDKGKNMPRYLALAPNQLHQADLLFMPNDKGFKYILTVIDAYSKNIAAEPLKSKKPKELVKAFKKIYKEGLLELPKIMRTDPGNEFKGELKKFFKDNGVYMSYGLPGRHRQVALVESLNKIIGTALHKRMTGQELLTGKKSVEWVEDLPVIVKAINKKAQPIKIPKKNTLPQCDGDSCKLLDIGTKVRRILDQPINAYDGKKLHGKFRSSDIRWKNEPRTITNILLMSGQPPLYQLDDGKGGTDRRVAYTKNQLQVIPKNEQLPDSKIIRPKKH